jgi:hypothetical protein
MKIIPYQDKGGDGLDQFRDIAKELITKHPRTKINSLALKFAKIAGNVRVVPSAVSTHFCLVYGTDTIKSCENFITEIKTAK